MKVCLKRPQWWKFIHITPCPCLHKAYLSIYMAICAANSFSKRTDVLCGMRVIVLYQWVLWLSHQVLYILRFKMNIVSEIPYLRMNSYTYSITVILIVSYSYTFKQYRIQFEGYKYSYNTSIYNAITLHL